jgi:hypothetical protein
MGFNITTAGLPTVEQYDVNRSIIEPIFMGQGLYAIYGSIT